MVRLQYLLFGIIFLSSASGAQSASKNISIVVNSNNSLKKISMEDVQKIYSGKTLRWRDGKRITVLNYRRGQFPRTQFYFRIFGAHDSKIFRYGKSRKIFKTIQLSDRDEIIKIVSEVEGAIGYIEGSVNIESKLRIVLVLQ